MHNLFTETRPPGVRRRQAFYLAITSPDTGSRKELFTARRAARRALVNNFPGKDLPRQRHGPGSFLAPP